jgi:hypothetical protein
MIQRHILYLLAGFALLLLALPAAVAETALSVRIPVDSQQPEAREQAMKQALSQVLLRMTGQEGIAGSEAAAQLLERPGRFLQRYQYETQPGQQLVLLMQFDGTAVRRALAAQGVATWGADRPPVLVWLAVEQNGRRLLVGGEEGGDLRSQLQTAASRRGLLLLFPLMDGEDRQRVSGADVFGGFTERVQQASDRYGAPLMLMGRMHRAGQGWAARWSLSGMGSMTWSTAGDNQEEVLDAAAAELATRLAARYAALPSAQAGARELSMQVVGVRTLRDYDRLERYLRSVSGIADMRPLLLEPEAVTLQMALEVAPERVLTLLEQSRSLIPVATFVGGTEPEQGSQAPVFRLAP